MPPSAPLDSTASLYVRLNSRDFIHFPKMKVKDNLLIHWNRSSVHHKHTDSGGQNKFLGINIKTATTPIADLDVPENWT